MNLTLRLAGHLGPSGTGQLLAGGTGFTISRTPDTVRVPDIAFIRRERLPDPEPAGFAELAPDLVVDVLSPCDTPLVIQARVGEWLVAGTSLVWVVDPRRRSVHVYRGDGTEEFVGPAGSLDGEDLLPGFSCPLEDVW